MTRFGVGRRCAAAALLALLPLTLNSCIIACGCGVTPDPNWTQPPVTAQEAAVFAATFAGGNTTEQPTDLVASLIYSDQDHPLFDVSNANVETVVDAHSGLVLEWIRVDSLPNSTDAVVSSAAAQTAAESFMSDRDRYTGELTPTTALRPGVAASAYVVTWAGQGFDAPGQSVSVNPSTGAPFAFVDERYGVRLVPPVLGAEAAGRLALAAVATPGLSVQSTDFVFGLENPSWQVNLVGPSATASAEPEHGAYVSVDAVTGAATVGKSF